ncbi:Transcription factor TFIIIB component B [Binucleata daphniae]
MKLLKDFLCTKRQKVVKKVVHTKEEDESSENEFVKVKEGKIVYNENKNYVKKEKFRSRQIIEDADVIVTAHTFSKKMKAFRWNDEKTDIFYEALKMVGTDFTLISEIFEIFELDRKQIRNKYIKESKVNQKRIDEAMGGKLKYEKKKYEDLKKRCNIEYEM